MYKLRMHFCNKCDNMYYIKISDENDNTLKYYCRNCGFEDNTLSIENTCVSKTQFKKGDRKFNHFINEYTKLDPTLPHISNLTCPNDECISRKDPSNNPSDIIYIRYDNTNMKFIYLCNHCNKKWTTNEK